MKSIFSMLLKLILEKNVINPKSLFIIDGLGAVISAFLLGFVLVKFESVFGIPPSTLFILATFPILFSIFDFYCYQKELNEPGDYLKILALLNLLYCILSLGFGFYHIETISIFGWTYVLLEIVIILILAMIEFKVAQKIVL